jgi:hypothetical protein
LCVVYV